VILLLFCERLQVELPLIVQELHQQRHSLIQTQTQYTFCYQALLAGLQTLAVDHWWRHSQSSWISTFIYSKLWLSLKLLGLLGIVCYCLVH